MESGVFFPSDFLYEKFIFASFIHFYGGLQR